MKFSKDMHSSQKQSVDKLKSFMHRKQMKVEDKNDLKRQLLQCQRYYAALQNNHEKVTADCHQLTADFQQFTNDNQQLQNDN